MTDYISRTDAIDAVVNAHPMAEVVKGSSKQVFWVRVSDVAKALKALPSADADAVQGEWIEREDWNGDYYYDCSVCGESFVLCDGTPSMNLYHYCPNCGARMKGGDDE